jgi:hypothetical protein
MLVAPPIAHDRIRLTADGDVLLELCHRRSDGTTQRCLPYGQVMRRAVESVDLMMYHVPVSG